VAISIASNVFVKLAYLNLIEYAVKDFRSIVNETDFATGLPKRELLLMKRNDILQEIAKITTRRYGRYSYDSLVRDRSDRHGDALNTMAKKLNKEPMGYRGQYSDSDNRYRGSAVISSDDDSVSRDANDWAFRSAQDLYHSWPLSTSLRVARVLDDTGAFGNPGAMGSNSATEDDGLTHELELISDTRVDRILSSERVKSDGFEPLVSLESLEAMMGSLEDGMGGLNANYNMFQGLNTGIIQVTNDGDAPTAPPIPDTPVTIPADEGDEVVATNLDDALAEETGSGFNNDTGSQTVVAIESFRERAERLQERFVRALVEKYS
jgi:hypothetical protein